MRLRLLSERLRQEDGVALADVIVGAALLAIVSAGLLASLDFASAVSGNTRDAVGASNVAHRDLERMRRMPVDQLVNYRQVSQADGYGRVARYDVESETIWMSDAVDGPSCTAQSFSTPVGAAAYLKLVSTVTWPGMGDTAPVVAETFVIPEAGFTDGTGAARARIVDEESVPVADVRVTLTRSGQTFTALTIADGGCVYFDRLAPGTYSWTIQKDGWTAPNGNPMLSGTLSVTAGTTVGGQAQMIRAGGS